MPRFENGWVKIERRCIFGDIGQRGNATLGLWVRLIAMALRQGSRILWNGKPRDLEPGQVLTGLPELADSDRQVDISQVRRSLEFLENRQSIRQEVGRRGRIVTICNWSVMNALSEESDSETTGTTTVYRQSVDSLPTGCRQLIGELENRRKEEEKKENNLALSGERAIKISALELEQAYREYPRKRGKKRGMELVRQKIKTKPELAELLQAIGNYKAECQAEQREEKHVQYFDTFMREWEDWIKPDCQQATVFDIGAILERRGLA